MIDKSKKIQIRNSTAEFLIFTNQSKTSTIEVRYEDETIWLSQKLMSELFDVEVNTINYHLKEIYKSGEIQEQATIRKFRIVQQEGNRTVNRDVEFYNLDAIISVGYRVNSVRATQFRQWATQVLKEYAIHQHTAAELIVERADSQKEYMGLTSWKNSPNGKILKSDVTIAKNYLTKDELDSLGRIVNAYLDLAENRAKRKIPMTMEDWAKRLDLFLQHDDRDILQNAGKISHEMANEYAETEFEKYRIIQDQLFQSDFDKLINKLDNKSLNE
ncbi:MAG TPA: RhuM family protein [Bacteroidales bacterium]|nr:RhuM family protein [Bacteroidales bacterium]HOH22603.1 RhuM family protein [Bacteroidales bacterium]HPB57212.1 RhuM family protein [Bacteroidales bacterium]HPZ03913.1 RhuM family protein [Bacteroidales bacterium]HQB75463.1 RhuM family protein [Bacteroidales bacterium]